MDEQYPTAPELPGKHPDRRGSEPAPERKPAVQPDKATGAHKIQLIESTKPHVDDEPPQRAFYTEAEMAELPDEDEDELNEHVMNPNDPDGVLANEQILEWQKDHPLPQASARRKRRWPKVLAVLVVVAALAAGAYWYGGSRAKVPSKPSAKTQAQATKKPAVQPDIPTKHYDSATYTLGFDYPEDWTVSDKPDKLTVTSPIEALALANGKNQQGQVVLTIQNQQSNIAGFPANGATAALASDLLVYKKPTQIQRAQTYFSYLSYGQAGALDALYVTGDSGYQAGQTVPMSDIVKGNPLLSVTFINCGTAGCDAGGSALSLQASSWKASLPAKEVVSTIESLQLN